jgi:hypothetical protein
VLVTVGVRVGVRVAVGVKVGVGVLGTAYTDGGPPTGSGAKASIARPASAAAP